MLDRWVIKYGPVLEKEFRQRRFAGAPELARVTKEPDVLRESAALFAKAST